PPTKKCATLGVAMSIEILKGGNVDVHLWTPVREVESDALDQLKHIAALPWAFHHVAVMPDVHYGKGATVGSVVAMKDAGAPAAVGVDIGCGMAAVKTNLVADKVERRLRQLRSAIEEAIPVGFEAHDEAVIDTLEDEELPSRVRALMARWSELSPKVQGLEGR